MNLKTTIALLGIFLFVVAMIFKNNFVSGEKSANTLDREDKQYGMIEGPLPCSWEAQEPERVVSESKSQAILVRVKNEVGEPCESKVSLRAPGFDISPIKEEQVINLDDGKEGSLSWILSPRKIGTYEIAISDPLNTKVYGITVTNVFGLSTVQAKLFSGLGTIFGPMLTIPWWWERLRKKKQPVVNEVGKENSK